MSLSKIILFDGVCNLCNGFVQFVIKRDKKNTFKFASLQSERAKQLLHDYNFSENKLDSIVLIDAVAHKAWTESSAALRIARELGGIYGILYAFIILPRFFRDGLYRLVSRNRYRWFGRKKECMLPGPDTKDRFI